MAVRSDELTDKRGLGRTWSLIQVWFAPVPLLGWLVGALIAVILELLIGTQFARLIGMSKAPVLFGFVTVLKEPLLVPSVLLYLILVYIVPVGFTARLVARPANWLGARMLDFPLLVSALVHLILLYAILHIWCELSDYRLLMVRLTLISVMVTLSLNLVNGYMGEFSCSHPGFMALGAYVASLLSVGLFVNDNLLGAAVLPAALGPWFFPLSVILGGLVAAAGALLVAIPSFRTRGDYLAIISLAFMFIVKSLIENLEFAGGSRGVSSIPNWANLPTVFIWTTLCVWIINNFVRSTLGKALNAVRDDEVAANAMSVNTRRTKMVAFLFAAFWAGAAGALMAHVISYINPGTFDLKKLAEVLAMVYFGGLNSVYGSILGAVGFNLLSEALRPLEIYKWIIIPVLLILVMIFRPTGLVAFREFDVRKLFQPKQNRDEV